MISIIVSSYKPDLFKQFEKNVEETIGVKYEIIKIDNPGRMGLCEAYNIGCIKAQYEYICFCHEDIIYHTSNWGKILISIFNEDLNIGIIGIAGSSYKTWVPSGWTYDYYHSHAIKQNYIQTNGGKLRYLCDNPYKENKSEVSTVDGAWLCTKKYIAEKYKFDQNLFNGYHCYDLDFCLTVGKDYKIIVTYDISIEHLSLGSFDKKWLIETLKLHKKWKDLPRIRNYSSSKEEILYQESRALCALIKKIGLYKKPYLIFRYNFSFRLIKLLGFKNWLFYNYIILAFIINKKNKS